MGRIRVKVRLIGNLVLPLKSSKRRFEVIRHLMTKYCEDGGLRVESWIQIDVFGRFWCVSRRVVVIEKGPLDGDPAPSDR